MILDGEVGRNAEDTGQQCLIQKRSELFTHDSDSDWERTQLEKLMLVFLHAKRIEWEID